MAADDVAPVTPGRATAALRGDLDKLYANKVVAQFGAKEFEEISSLQSKIDELQHEYVEKQTLQDLMEKLSNVQREDDLRAMLGAQERVQAEYRKRRAELDAAVTERRLHIAKIGELLEEVDREKENVAKREQSRPEFESELEKLKAEWKELQKRNAQRKATIQMATGMMINNEEDCTRILETQTREIQELHEKQKRLEEKKVDLSTRVKQTTEKISRLEKENDIRSRDLLTKQREEECAALEHMKEWYKNMSQLLATLTGIDITQITNEFMELSFLRTHSARLYFDSKTTKLSGVQLLQDDIDASDLAETAVRTNNAQFFAIEYLGRLIPARAASM